MSSVVDSSLRQQIISGKLCRIMLPKKVFFAKIDIRFTLMRFHLFSEWVSNYMCINVGNWEVYDVKLENTAQVLSLFFRLGHIRNQQWWGTGHCYPMSAVCSTEALQSSQSRSLSQKVRERASIFFFPLKILDLVKHNVKWDD